MRIILCPSGAFRRPPGALTFQPLTSATISLIDTRLARIFSGSGTMRISSFRSPCTNTLATPLMSRTSSSILLLNCLSCSGWKSPNTEKVSTGVCSDFTSIITGSKGRSTGRSARLIACWISETRRERSLKFGSTSMVICMVPEKAVERMTLMPSMPFNSCSIGATISRSTSFGAAPG